MFIPTSLVDYLLYAAKFFSQKVAIIDGKNNYTYQEIDMLSNRLANGLCELGLQRNDRVIVCLENGIEVVILVWAVLKVNAIISIVNPTIVKKKLLYVLQDAAAKFLVIDDKTITPQHLFANKINLTKIIYSNNENKNPDFLNLKNLLAVTNDASLIRKNIDIDLASIIYTSGSTGVPKGVMLTHRSMLTASTSINEYLKLNYADVIISALPLSFDYGLYRIFLACMNGATLVIEKDFSWPIQFIKNLYHHKATVFPAVSTMFSILEKYREKISYDLSSVRCVTNTGAILLKKHTDLIKVFFPKSDIYSMYGLTECKRCTYLPPSEIDNKPNSVGIAIPNTEMWVVDENEQQLAPGNIGQLVIRGATVMLGYWNKPIETKKVLKDGLLPGEKILFTGDFGYLDEEGYFYFCGRNDEMIKISGEKVILREIQETIYLLPQIHEVIVIDFPNDLTGASIIVFVSSYVDKEIIENIVMDHCKVTLAKNCWPKEVIVLKELPKNNNGKIDKAGLKAEYLSRFKGPAMYEFTADL